MTGFRLEPGEPFAAGLKRIAGEEVDAALASLCTLEPDPDTAVHSARKRLKKVRSVLRLARGVLADDHYARERIAYRDVARRLAPFRDPPVRIATIDALTRDFTGILAHDAFADLRMQLLGAHRSALRELRDASAIDPIAADLAVARERIGGWALEDGDFRPLALGLERAYRRGRKRMAKAYAAPAAGRFHEWRKRAKDLWYQVRLVALVWPRPMGALAEELHELAEILGDGHDLSLLEAELERLAPTGRRAREALRGLIVIRRDGLRRAARGPGQRIYVEKATAFAERVGAYGASWLAEHPTRASAGTAEPPVLPLHRPAAERAGAGQEPA